MKPFTLVFWVCCSSVNGTKFGFGWWPAFLRNLAPFSPTAQTVPLSGDHLITVHASTAACFPRFVNDDCSDLATSFFAVFCEKPFSSFHSHASMWGNGYSEAMPHLHNHLLLPRLSFMYKYNSSTGVGGNIFFPPLLKDVTFGVCGLMWENKSRCQGAFSQREDFLSQQRKKRRKPWYSWLRRGNYAA